MIIKIITGMAGGGKSTALDAFEDMGYYCIDNLPPNLLKEFIHLHQNSPSDLEALAVVMDLRLGIFFEDVWSKVEELKDLGYDIEIIFVEASEDVLMKRFSETRRNHPLETTGDRRQAIRSEKTKLSKLRDRADRIIDTSQYNSHQLKRAIQESYRADQNDYFQVIVTAFGIKHGDLEGADFSFDLRFLPNPYYIEELRTLSGHDQAVRSFIMDDDTSRDTLDKIKSLLDTVVPAIKQSGRHTVNLGFGCTGGRHRSITFAILVGDHLREQGYQVVHLDRDLSRG
ncbi:MAG TPA: RNase adapter RapZ [Tissierellia bacterium]|nr:RNase adapter RapZ [Tissierellia bacterium]